MGRNIVGGEACVAQTEEDESIVSIRDELSHVLGEGVHRALSVKGEYFAEKCQNL